MVALLQAKYNSPWKWRVYCHAEGDLAYGEVENLQLGRASVIWHLMLQRRDGGDDEAKLPDYLLKGIVEAAKLEEENVLKMIMWAAWERKDWRGNLKDEKFANEEDWFRNHEGEDVNWIANPRSCLVTQLKW